jgi:hypothetical protein
MVDGTTTQEESTDVPAISEVTCPLGNLKQGLIDFAKRAK